MKLLEDKLKALEEKQGGNTVSAALSSVRNAFQKPGTVYDPSEASAHVEALVRAARSVAHEKVDYYAAILDELKGSSSSLSSSAHQRLLLRLLGEPTRAKVAKESSALLKLFSVRSRRSLAVRALARSGANALMPPVNLFASDAACPGTLRGLVIADEVVGIISVKE